MHAALRESNVIPGLCSVCNRMMICERRFREGVIMWYCAECDRYMEPQLEPEPAQPAAVTVESEMIEKLMGLCVNCERRDYCTHAKRVGGVWHCEEYL